MALPPSYVIDSKYIIAFHNTICQGVGVMCVRNAFLLANKHVLLR